jgi:lysozyme family protein
MAQSSFDKVMAFVLHEEGGYVNDPHDPGGATNLGVTQRVYNGYRIRIGKGVATVKGISMPEAAEIYRTSYWHTIHGDELPVGIDLCVMDAAVNSGPGQAAKWLQACVGAPIDGFIGHVTLSRAMVTRDRIALVNALCDRRLTFMQGLKAWVFFKKGWRARVERVRRAALDML